MNLLTKIIRMLKSIRGKIIYIIEENWAIQRVGQYITENLNKANIIEAELGSYKFSRNKIVHFGDIGCLILSNKYIQVHKSNNVVLTWYHIVPGDKRLKYIPLINKRIDLWHTPSIITKETLIKYGIPKEKIILGPLGVDLKVFKMYDKSKKDILKIKYNLPKDKIIIGSFQKDGVGWGEGNQPKLIKGPDIFCEVVKRLNRDFNIHVFLVGPARGYVKNQLTKNGIHFSHIMVKNYLEIVECYNVIDLYIIPSRTEGGPLALLEGMATGVPIVSTKVGMVPELINNGINGFVSEIEDIEQLYENSKKLLNNDKLKEKIIKNGLNTIKNYSWEEVALVLYKRIYRKLLKGLN